MRDSFIISCIGETRQETTVYRTDGQKVFVARAGHIDQGHPIDAVCRSDSRKGADGTAVPGTERHVNYLAFARLSAL
jgi:hypothetical protein